MLRRLDEDHLAAAVTDAALLARFQDNLAWVPGSECVWWTGPINHRGHGQFPVAEKHVVIAHRFAYALVHGVAALPGLLAHRCHNPLCQRIGDGHVVEATATLTRAEKLARPHIPLLTDSCGPRGRAVALRNLARIDGTAVRADHDRLDLLVGHQPPLF